MQYTDVTNWIQWVYLKFFISNWFDIKTYISIQPKIYYV